VRGLLALLLATEVTIAQDCNGIPLPERWLVTPVTGEPWILYTPGGAYVRDADCGCIDFVRNDSRLASVCGYRAVSPAPPQVETGP